MFRLLLLLWDEKFQGRIHGRENMVRKGGKEKKEMGLVRSFVFLAGFPIFNEVIIHSLPFFNFRGNWLLQHEWSDSSSICLY